MYVCGMTPKYHPHVGHARLFVAMDVIRRYLEYRGYEVKHVQNFTDIDDKIIARGQSRASAPTRVAAGYTESYFEVMEPLNVRRAHDYPTVTGSWTRSSSSSQGLIERGYAYAADGDVYFDVASFPDYGKLSGRDLERASSSACARSSSPASATRATSPSGSAPSRASRPGRAPGVRAGPGWHIECSAMVRETLGDQIDIHARRRAT